MPYQNKREISIIVIISFVAGGISGGLVAPFSVDMLGKRFIPEQNQTMRNSHQQNYASEEAKTINVISKTNPAVVSVSIYKEQSTAPNRLDRSPDDLFGPNLFFPFEQLPNTNENNTTQKDQSKKQLKVGGGSGFIIQEDGLVVTNKHVVDDEKALYKVTLSDGKVYEAKVIAKDPILDVAIIKIGQIGLPTLKFGNSDTLQLGQSVIAIGNALAEYGNTVTRGVISGIGRRVEAGSRQGGFSEVIDDAIQTDAAINPGNSGGPMLNLDGEVVGINTAISESGRLIGFAIPINSVRKTIESIQKTGHIVRPWLGVRYIAINPEIAEANNLTVKAGALIVRGQQKEELAVIPDSPADKVGIVENDIILEVNGKKLEEYNSLGKEVSKFDVGQQIDLKILHEGKEKTVRITLTELPSIDMQ